MVKQFSDKTSYQRKTINEGTRQILVAANKMLATSYFGNEKSPITLVQGSYSGGVAASAGTHNGGGAFDITSYNGKNRVRVLRILGTTADIRIKIIDIWDEHIHGIVCGDGSASKGAKYQVSEYYSGRNGLANRRRDTGWRPYKLPILFKLNGNLSRHYITTKTEIGRAHV